MAVIFDHEDGKAFYQMETQTEEKMYVQVSETQSTTDGKTYTKGKSEVFFSIVQPEYCNKEGVEKALYASLNKEGVEDLINLLQYLKNQM